MHRNLSGVSVCKSELWISGILYCCRILIIIGVCCSSEWRQEHDKGGVAALIGVAFELRSLETNLQHILQELYGGPKRAATLFDSSHCQQSKWHHFLGHCIVPVRYTAKLSTQSSVRVQHNAHFDEKCKKRFANTLWLCTISKVQNYFFKFNINKFKLKTH